LAALAPVGSFADDKYWVGGSGDWVDPANWATSPSGAGGAGMPNEESGYVHSNDATDRQVRVNSTTTLPPVARLELSGEGSGVPHLRVEQGGFKVAGYLHVGYLGSGRVTQSGGSVDADYRLLVTFVPGAFGRYDMTGGALHTGSIQMSADTDRHVKFVQAGGQVVAGEVGVSGPGASYELGAGTLTTPHATISEARMVHQGGELRADSLDVWGGEYQWTGGTLRIDKRWNVGGPMTFPATPVSVAFDGVAIFADVALTNPASLSLTLGEHSLMIRPASLDPSTTFGHYSNAGLEHVTGTVLTVPAGRTIHLSGQIDERMTVMGTLTSRTPQDESVSLFGQIALHDGGEIAVRYVHLRGGSRLSGGKLTAYTLEVSGVPLMFPFDQGGTTQEAGQVEVNSLKVGPFGHGRYTLNGGGLTTSTTSVGSGDPVLSTGTFTHTGGVHRATSVAVGMGAGGTGSYRIGGSAELIVDSLGVSMLSGRFFDDPQWGQGELDINGAGARIEVSSQFSLGAKARLLAVPGATVTLKDGADWVNHGNDPSQLAGLEVLRVLVDGSDPEGSRFEVAGRDLGAGEHGFENNFLIDTLQVGGAEVASLVLANDIDNQDDFAGPEALYLNRLILGTGSTLDLAGLHVYTRELIDGGGNVISNGGSLTVVPEPGTGAIVAILALALNAKRVRRDSPIVIS
jgi:hypothetical protein